MVVATLQPVGVLIFNYVYGFFGVLMMCVGALMTAIVKGPGQVFHIKSRNERPEILDSEEWGTHHFARLKRITLHYVQKGSEDKPLMLFLHGFPEFWFSWRNQLKHFSTNYRAVALDMRGYGESQKPKGVVNYHTNELTADIRDFVHALGYEKCVLVGHDWGGGVAWNVAQAYPEVVDKLIVCNCPHPVTMLKHFSKSLTQLRKSWYMFAFQWPFFAEFMLSISDFSRLDKALVTRAGRPSDEEMEAYKYTYTTFESREAPVNYYRAALRYATGRRGPVLAPTLVVWGTGDLFLGSEMAQASADYVGKHCSVRFIEGATHFVQQDAPKEVNESIDQFMASFV